jgi:hypothetical protein
VSGPEDRDWPEGASYEQLEHAVITGVAEMLAHVPESVSVGVLGAHDVARAKRVFEGTRLVGLLTTKTAVTLATDTPGGPLVGCDVAIRQESYASEAGEVVVARYYRGVNVADTVFDDPAKAAAAGIEFASEDDEPPSP